MITISAWVITIKGPLKQMSVIKCKNGTFKTRGRYLTEAQTIDLIVERTGFEYVEAIKKAFKKTRPL